MPQKQFAQLQIQPDGGAPVPQVRVRHILIQPEPGADDQSKATAAEWAAALAKAKAARAALLRPGASWVTVAKTYSQDPSSAGVGGDIGWLDPANAQVVPEFLKAIQTLQLNQISQPVKSQFGYHVIQVFELRSSAAGQAVTLEAELEKDLGSVDKAVAREILAH